MKKRKSVDAAIRGDTFSIQPFWDSKKDQELNSNYWFETEPDGLNIITRFSTETFTSGVCYATLLNGTASGSDGDERKGRVITMHQLRIRWAVGNDVTGAGNVYIVYDKAPNGAAPDLTYGEGNTFFTNNDTGAAWPGANYLWPNHHNEGRLIWLGVGEHAASRPATVYTFDLRGLKTYYSGTGDTIASINTGALYLVTANGSGTASSWSRGWQLSYWDE